MDGFTIFKGAKAVGDLVPWTTAPSGAVLGPVLCLDAGAVPGLSVGDGCGTAFGAEVYENGAVAQIAPLYGASDLSSATFLAGYTVG